MKQKKTRRANERTLEFCRNMGWLSGVVERWIPNPRHPAGGVRRDFLNVIDIICVKQGSCTVGIQSTSINGHSAHVKTALESEELAGWLSVDSNKFEIWSWGRIENPTTRRRWKLRIEQVTVGADGVLTTFGYHEPCLDNIDMRDFT